MKRGVWSVEFKFQFVALFIIGLMADAMLTHCKRTDCHTSLRTGSQ